MRMVLKAKKRPPTRPGGMVTSAYSMVGELSEYTMAVKSSTTGFSFEELPTCVTDRCKYGVLPVGGQAGLDHEERSC